MTYRDVDERNCKRCGKPIDTQPPWHTVCRACWIRSFAHPGQLALLDDDQEAA